ATSNSGFLVESDSQWTIRNKHLKVVVDRTTGCIAEVIPSGGVRNMVRSNHQLGSVLFYKETSFADVIEPDDARSFVSSHECRSVWIDRSDAEAIVVAMDGLIDGKPFRQWTTVD